MLVAAVFILAIGLGWYCNLKSLAVFCVFVLELSLVSAFYELQDAVQEMREGKGGTWLTSLLAPEAVRA